MEFDFIKLHSNSIQIDYENKKYSEIKSWVQFVTLKKHDGER